MVKIKIEIITVNSGQSKIFHFSSEGVVNELKVNNKNFYPDILHYVENYCNENGFEILQAFSPAIGTDRLYLVKK